MIHWLCRFFFGLVVAAAAMEPSFNRDVAPLIFAKCVSCHYAGGPAPFPLTSFREVKKRVKDVVKVTGSRYMPPWLPAPGHGNFEGARSLTDEEIRLLAAWQQNGTPEGLASDLQVKPEWTDGWQLGPPDWVATMTEPYVLPATGPDVYRNFVIPSMLTEDRYVVSFELRSSSPTALHHAFVLLDASRISRQLDAKEPGPGYSGMSAGPGAGAPVGAFASWQPGARIERRPEALAWVLPKKSDLVLQLHLRPTGKKERVQVSVGFYFTPKQPVRQPMVMCLRSTNLDIPAGEANYAIEKSYTLPVDGQVLSILPHTHYLGKDLQAWAELPDGTQCELLWIPNWDFNWQGSYRFREPLALPQGTRLRMRYTYDNSKANLRNPSKIPVRVRFGLQSSDEMGEFWLQFLPDRPSDLLVLEQDFLRKVALPDKIDLAQTLLARNAKDADARLELAAAYLASGQTSDAEREARQALSDNPRLARAHYLLGSIYAGREAVEAACAEFEALVSLDPNDSEGQNNLGFLYLAQGKVEEAISHLEKAVSLNPDDALAKRNLEGARAARR